MTATVGLGVDLKRILRVRRYKKALNARMLRRRKAVGVSFPKSGRTWCRKMLIDLDVNVPFTHAGTDAIIKGESHEAPDPAAFFDHAVLFLIRDPRDVVVSYYHDLSRRHQVFDGDLSALVRHPALGVCGVIAFNMAWFAARERFRGFHLIRYERMREDTVREIADIRDFLGLWWITKRRIARICEEADFERMRRQEGEGALAAQYKSHWFADGADPNAPRKVRRGKAGGFVDEMSPEDVAYCDAALRESGYPEDWLAAPLGAAPDVATRAPAGSGTGDAR